MDSKTLFPVVAGGKQLIVTNIHCIATRNKNTINVASGTFLTDVIDIKARIPSARVDNVLVFRI